MGDHVVLFTCTRVRGHRGRPHREVHMSLNDFGHRLIEGVPPKGRSFADCLEDQLTSRNEEGQIQTVTDPSLLSALSGRNLAENKHITSFRAAPVSLRNFGFFLISLIISLLTNAFLFFWLLCLI
jgi:hypothetical protein